MTIYREGKAIELTRGETLQAYNEVLKKAQVAMIEDKIEDAGFSFDSFSEFDYQSETDFRDDFTCEVFKLFEDYYYNMNYSEQAAMDEAIESTAKEYSLEYNY